MKTKLSSENEQGRWLLEESREKAKKVKYVQLPMYLVIMYLYV